MSDSNRPLVSIVTPVYNEAAYLPQCIESIQSQTYPNWEYTIIDNHSTDGSLEIARKYAQQDCRIHVGQTESFCGVMDSHNAAVRSISPAAKYCKIVSGDDWIYPECLDRLVSVAEQHDNVGVVGSYLINKYGVRKCFLPIEHNVFPGREAAGAFLLGQIDSFFAPTCVLYRADLVRARRDFFPGSKPSGDLAVCLEILMNADLGFVHQVLGFERIHSESETAVVRKLDNYLLDRLELLDRFAQGVLTREQHMERRKQILDAYYRDVVAVGLLNGRSSEFWKYHKDQLRQIGHPWDHIEAAKAVAVRILDLLLNPGQTAEKIMRRLGRSSRRDEQAWPAR